MPTNKSTDAVRHKTFAIRVPMELAQSVEERLAKLSRERLFSNDWRDHRVTLQAWLTGLIIDELKRVKK